MRTQTNSHEVRRLFMELSQSLENVFRLTPRQMLALKKLDIATARDLLFYFPARYETFTGEKTIAALAFGERTSVQCEVVEIAAEKTWKKRLSLAEATVKDATGVLRAVWFNQPYIARMLPAGSAVRLTGKVARDRKGLYLANPTFDAGRTQTSSLPTSNSGFLAYESMSTLSPIYPETWGITSRWFAARIKKIFEARCEITELLPEDILLRYHLPKIKTALRAIHFPKNKAEAEAARKRFSFEEIFLIQLLRQRERQKFSAAGAYVINPHNDLMRDFFSSLPFSFTNAQRRALEDILADFKKPRPMARLLEGDVGSGKTVVAAGASLAAAKAGCQTAFLAPTEILARQHFDELAKRLEPFRVPIGLLTLSEAKKFPSKAYPGQPTKISKRQMLKWLESGEIKIIVGTHALVEKRVRFKKLGFVVVDEQHRFGTEQRHSMITKANRGSAPHFLSMSATPIPRTLALTLWGNLDLSVIDEMPPGRKPIKTKIIHPNERAQTYKFISDELKNGGQAFVVCPRIEEKKLNAGSRLPASGYQQRMRWDDVKSVKTEYKKLAEQIFPNLNIGMIHGRMKPNEKETTMNQFRKGTLQMIVATSIIEVGVDVPNASIMMIEGGERFGLATLHQFRGRVGRKGQQAYCFVFTTNADQIGIRRLKALEGTKTGFDLAEYDLQFRGPGELSGKRQWGISDIGMEAIKNIKMVEAAQTEAARIIAEDPNLEKYPLLKERVEKMDMPHFE